MRQIIGTTAEWIADDLVIGDGEIALERTGGGELLIKVGNGVDQYTDLPYLTLTAFGSGYTWRNVTGTRPLATNHTSPNHPIQISVRLNFVSNDGTSTITVGGQAVAFCGNGGLGTMAQAISAIIPPNTVYRIDNANISSYSIYELRAD